MWETLEDGRSGLRTENKTLFLTEGWGTVRTVTAKGFSNHLNCISEALLGKLDVEAEKKTGFSFLLSEFYTSVRHRRFRSLRSYISALEM